MKLDSLKQQLIPYPRQHRWPGTMAAGRDAVLPAEKPADRGPGNQQGQRPTQDRTCKSTEGAAYIKNLGTVFL
ncbi:hypothetical protein B296_00010366 [Ensete ventricosum]|uniref:Uncharacterized protein n=1 Tax=Ensete ventricosum TaxID=4639 RepID=A0A426ZWY4_ENSVE|nr:hypothetical protein B296_00010366 [Ensete ventricosum]